MSKERPILFSGPMVRAILAGTKTQTRRVIKTRHLFDVTNAKGLLPEEMRERRAEPVRELSPEDVVDPNLLALCPYGQPGDRLWVKEEQALLEVVGTRTVHCDYKADGVSRRVQLSVDEWRKFKARRSERAKQPGMFMYRSCSRINLEVVNVRVEHVQAITEEDATAEGMTPDDVIPSVYTPREAYQLLWCQINGFGSWSADPWVWAVSFKQVAA